MENGESSAPQSSLSGSCAGKCTISLCGLAICASRKEWSVKACAVGVSLMSCNHGYA